MNYRQIYARKAEREKRIKKVCPDCPNTSGIYFFLREENGFRFGYIGKALNLLERLGQHLSGYHQHIDRSLKKHGLWSEDNPTGYKVHFLTFPESKLNEMEQHFIKIYANAGYQLRNVESGGQKGKTDIGERKPAKGYYDGIEQGYKNARRFIANLFEKHLTVGTKKQPPTKNAEKALEKFEKFIDLEAEENA